MPPKAKITRDMVVNAAFEVARESGAEKINARSVSCRLNCSTQPVMWHFKTIAEMKKAAYEKTDAFHSDYLLNLHGGDPMKQIGLNYIRFAANEKNLFRFLFQSDGFSGKSLADLMDGAEFLPICGMLSQQTQTDMAQAKRIFRSLFLYVHGYASMLANNAMSYCERELERELELAFEGAVYAAGKGGQ